MKGTLRGPLSDQDVQELWRKMNAEAIEKTGWSDPMNWVVGACVLMAACGIWQVWFQ